MFAVQVLTVHSNLRIENHTSHALQVSREAVKITDLTLFCQVPDFEARMRVVADSCLLCPCSLQCMCWVGAALL